MTRRAKNGPAAGLARRRPDDKQALLVSLAVAPLRLRQAIDGGGQRLPAIHQHLQPLVELPGELVEFPPLELNRPFFGGIFVGEELTARMDF